VTGRTIVVVSWVSVAVFTVVAVIDAFGVDAFDVPAATVSLVLFFASILIWMYALGLAFVRNARGDDIMLPTLFLLSGSAPRDVRWHLLGSFVVSIVVAAVTGSANPFGWLVPMFTLGLVGLWGARHGSYPPRRDAAFARSGNIKRQTGKGETR
jgi:hypothetical protein